MKHLKSKPISKCQTIEMFSVRFFRTWRPAACGHVFNYPEWPWLSNWKRFKWYIVPFFQSHCAIGALNLHTHLNKIKSGGADYFSGLSYWTVIYPGFSHCGWAPILRDGHKGNTQTAQQTARNDRPMTRDRIQSTGASQLCRKTDPHPIISFNQEFKARVGYLFQKHFW